MKTNLELRFGVPSINCDNGIECWNIIELTLEEVALISRALRKYGTSAASKMASNLIDEMGQYPQALDVYERETRNIAND